MKLILTVPRTSSITPVLIPYTIHCMMVFLSFVFLTPVAHSTADPGRDLEINRQYLVEEFKAKVLEHMGWSSPPRGYNSSRQSPHAKLIREFFRKKFRTGYHRHGFDDFNHLDSHLGDQQTVVFPSTDPQVWVEVQPVNPLVGLEPINSPQTPLTSVEFTTNFQQPDVPYKDLLIKSAILRMRISRQKRKLRGNDKSIVNMTFYLLRKASNISGDKVIATLLHSRTVNTHRNKIIEIRINPQLLSYILDSDEKTVSIGITIAPVSSVKHKVGRIQKLLHIIEEINQQTSQHLTEEPALVSKATLRVTTVKPDLRKSRSKRDDNNSPSCNENECCKHSIHIDFEDIGWDWVMYPAGFTAYYCKGGCRDRSNMASTFTIIKSILHERDPDVVPGPVCAPEDYAPLDLMLFINGDIQEVSYPGMVVTGCRCH